MRTFNFVLIYSHKTFFENLYFFCAFTHTHTPSHTHTHTRLTILALVLSDLDETVSAESP
jgi:hypothetical protein